MKTLRNLTALGLFGALALAAASCGDTNNPAPEPEPVKQSFTVDSFDASLKDYVTRADGSYWEEGDQIGVFAMTYDLSYGSDLSPKNIPFGYTSGTNGDFTAVDAPLSGEYTEEVTLFAYYPYKAAQSYVFDKETRSVEFTIDLTDQSSLSDIDFMLGVDQVIGGSYGPETPPGSSDEFVPNFEFTHMLSMVGFTFMDPRGPSMGFIPDKASVTVEGLEGSAVCGINNATDPLRRYTYAGNQDLKKDFTFYGEAFKQVDSSDPAIGEFEYLPTIYAILRPGDTISQVTTNIFGVTQTVTLDPAITLEEGKIYSILFDISNGQAPNSSSYEVTGVTTSIVDWEGGGRVEYPLF